MVIKNYKTLLESYNVPLVVVDVQPAYDKWCNHITPGVVDLINKHKQVKIFYNGEDTGITEDYEYDVLQYYYEYGLDEDEEYKLDFKDKGYGFYRGWMDSGIDDRIIIKIIREMVIQRENDSRYLDLEEILSDFEYDQIQNYLDDSIYMPDISIPELRSYNGCYMVGGGKNECLKELTLLFNAFNIKYKIIKSLTY